MTSYRIQANVGQLRRDDVLTELDLKAIGYTAEDITALANDKFIIPEPATTGAPKATTQP